MPTTLIPIRIAPIPTAFLDRVRRHGIDDLGQPVRRVIAEGGEPCRDALRRAEAGEPLILASFSPFSKTGPYKEFGPVFVLANDHAGNVERTELPKAGGPSDYLRDQFVIRAYSAAEEIVDAEMVKAADLGAVIDRFFASDNTAFLHVRFPTYGCFACRIDRG